MLFDSLPGRVRARLRPAVAAAYDRCVSDPDAPAPEVLRASCDAYWAHLQGHAVSDEFFDHATAGRTYRGCLALIDHVEATDHPEARAAVAAAVRYFVLEDDAQSDADLLGLDDDLEVVEATAAELGVTLP